MHKPLIYEEFFYTRCRKMQAKSLVFSYASVKKIAFYQGKVDLGTYFFTCEKIPQINFCCQNYSVENNYLRIIFRNKCEVETLKYNTIQFF